MVSQLHISRTELSARHTFFFLVLGISESEYLETFRLFLRSGLSALRVTTVTLSKMVCSSKKTAT